MNIFFIGVVVSILVYIVVGIWAGRSVKDVNDYYVSGRNAPTILIAGTLFASMLSVNGFMGDQGNTARAFVQYMDSDREYTADDKLYMREAHFVIAIGPGEGRTMSEIAREMNVTQGAVSQIASRLEKKGYVCRRKNEENKRQIIAFLTEKGEQFYTEHQRYDESMHRQMDEIALNRFNEEELQCIFEYEQIMEMLLKEEALTRHLTEKSKN